MVPTVTTPRATASWDSSQVFSRFFNGALKMKNSQCLLSKSLLGSHYLRLYKVSVIGNHDRSKWWFNQFLTSGFLIGCKSKLIYFWRRFHFRPSSKKLQEKIHNHINFSFEAKLINFIHYLKFKNGDIICCSKIFLRGHTFSGKLGLNTKLSSIKFIFELVYQTSWLIATYCVRSILNFKFVIRSNIYVLAENLNWNS